MFEILLCNEKDDILEFFTVKSFNASKIKMYIIVHILPT